ncbi:MAG: universal stress protein [Snowella sp.]|nr:MAG: universal stress protein [Snowella sp.]
MTYSKILVAIDRSDLGDVVFQQALDIAKVNKQNPSQLLLVHCIPVESQVLSPYPSFYSEEMVSFSQLVQERLKKETEEVEQWLADYDKVAADQGVVSESKWKMGDPGRWVRDLADSWEADLIVLGRRGLTGVAEMFLGSVSNYIVHHVNCSVLVVQETTTKVKA